MGSVPATPWPMRVLEKAGMRRERHEVKALWHHELGWLDDVGFALLDQEWPLRTRVGNTRT